MAFKIIGMQLNQPGQQVIAFAINRPIGNRRTRINRHDLAVPNFHTAAKAFLRQNEIGIGKNELRHVLVLSLLVS